MKIIKQELQEIADNRVQQIIRELKVKRDLNFVQFQNITISNL